MKGVILAASVAFATLSVAACERNPGTGGSPQVPSSQGGVAAQTSFTLADRNGDGAVSREEASTIANLDFAAADADSNAQLSPEEYRTAMEAARPQG